MLKKILFTFVLLIFFTTGWLLRGVFENNEPQIPIIEQIKERPFEKYEFEKLSQETYTGGIFEIGDRITESDNFNSYFFTFEFNPDPEDKKTKIISGQINIPNVEGAYPMVLMFRGYIDQTLFRTGDGTRNAAAVFAENGFITVAPDFLGYGESDTEAGNIFETRFQTYVTAISLIKYLESNPKITSVNSNWKLPALRSHDEGGEMENLFLWGHSNGGQIALTVLEISGGNYPTTLWAPVSKPFPYSVLYYTDESVDRGKLIRRELSKFEEDHDVEKYSLTNYLDRISAPIQIHQGESDDSVPVVWSNTLVNLLKQKEKDVEYYTYPGTDHNMRPSWDSVVERDLEFFRKYLKI